MFYSDDITLRNATANMFTTVLVLLFILRIRFTNGKSTAEMITRSRANLHSRPTDTSTGSSSEPRNLNCDLKFLNCCELYNIIPNFLGFTLYDKFLSTKTYKSWLFKVLDLEIERQKQNSMTLQITVL